MATTVYLFGDRKTCSKTRRFLAQDGGIAASGDPGVAWLRDLLPGANVVYADRKEDPALFNLYRPRGVMRFVVVRVMTETKQALIFETDGKTPMPKIADRIAAACPECTERGTPAKPPAVPVTPSAPAGGCKCPSCGKALKIVAAGLLLAFVAGCTATRVRVSGGEWTVTRLSVLQRVANQRITVDGVGSMEGYANDGGADLVGQLIALGVQSALKSQCAAAPTASSEPAVAP